MTFVSRSDLCSPHVGPMCGPCHFMIPPNPLRIPQIPRMLWHVKPVSSHPRVVCSISGPRPLLYHFQGHSIPQPHIYYARCTFELLPHVRNDHFSSTATISYFAVTDFMQSDQSDISQLTIPQFHFHHIPPFAALLIAHCYAPPSANKWHPELRSKQEPTLQGLALGQIDTKMPVLLCLAMSSYVLLCFRLFRLFCPMSHVGHVGCI